MELKTFLNLLLLSLSLTTIIITLITYVLYKLRQISSQAQNVQLVKLNGSFFKRYAPLLEKENISSIKSGLNKAQRFRFVNNLGFLFILGVGIIFSLFLTENYLAERDLKRSRAHTADLYKNLLSQGLMKQYDFIPNQFQKQRPQPNYSYLETATKSKADSLRALKFAIFTNETNLKLYPFHRDSFAHWQNFFNRQNLPFTKVTHFKNCDYNVIILPQVAHLSAKQIIDISNCTKQGVSLMSTGPVGYLSEKQQETIQYFARQQHHVLFEKTQETNLFPTLLFGNKEPWWDTPPGTYAELLPLNSQFSAISANTERTPTSFEVNYNSHQRKMKFQGQAQNIIHSTAVNHENYRAVWLAFDPNLTKKDNNFFIQENVFVSSLYWLSKQTTVQLSHWPEGADSVLSLSFTLHPLEFKKEVSELNKKNMPSTIFLSEMTGDEQLTFAEKNNSLYDFGIALPNNKFIESKDERALFSYIENQRMYIEDLTRKPLLGAYSDQLILPEQILSGVAQNKLKYILGTNLSFGFSLTPTSLAGFYFIPNITSNNMKLKFNRFVASEHEAKDIVKSEMQWVKNIGGLYNFHVDKTMQAEESPLVNLDDIIENAKRLNLHFVKYSEIIDWENKKSNLNLFQENGNWYIKNMTDKKVTNIFLRVDGIQKNSTKSSVDMIKIDHLNEYETRIIPL